MGFFDKSTPPPEPPGEPVSGQARQEPPGQAGDGRVAWPKLGVFALLSGVGVAALILIAIALGDRSSYLHHAAIADPATLGQSLPSGSMAIVFNQPVTGQLNVTLDLRPGSTLNHISIDGFLHRNTDNAKSIQWAAFSYGSLKLFPLATIGGYPTDANGNPVNTNGRPIINGAFGFEGSSEPVNIDPSLCNRNIANPTSSAGLSKILGCTLQHLDDPNFVPGKLEVHHGTITLGKNAYMDFNLDGKVIGTLEAVSTGLIEGTISPIGGTTVLGWTQGSWTAQNVPNYSQEAIEKAMYNFLPGGPQAPFPTSNITVHETIQTAWSSSDGALSAGTSIITGVTAFPDPTHLALTWKPDVSSYSTVTWEIENRLEENLAQSQDFLAGIWAAVAVTAGLMALAVIGNVIRTIIYGRMKD